MLEFDGLAMMYPKSYSYDYPMTPLMLCVKAGTQKAAEKLLKAGANPDVETKIKERTVTAIQLAKDEGQHQVQVEIYDPTF